MLELDKADRFVGVREQGASRTFLLGIWGLFFLDVQADDEVLMADVATAASRFAETALAVIVEGIVEGSSLHLTQPL